jgi:hypothetical protein
MGLHYASPLAIVLPLVLAEYGMRMENLCTAMVVG